MTEKSFPYVGFSPCEDYSADRITELLREHFARLGYVEGSFSGKKVVLKPNLVSAKDPATAATTHPTFVEAAYRLAMELGAEDVLLAESPGGPYNRAALSIIYRKTGMTELSERTGLRLNYDFSYGKFSYAEGHKLKEFDLITPISEADVIINLCKLKTHSLTGLSCSFKNLFGVIPGTLKFEMHAAYSTIDEFSKMLTELNMALAAKKEIISVCDAVVSMEGNGPTNGTPVRTDMLFVSNSTTALDIVTEEFIGLPGETLYLDLAASELGLPRDCPKEIKEGLKITVKLRRPDSQSGGILKNLSGMMGGRVARFFEPKPKVNASRCIGCGKCLEFCPQKTIVLKERKGKRRALINETDCIRCYCCQELCPSGAVDTVKNVLLRIIH